jgi:hypothetical protein
MKRYCGAVVILLLLFAVPVYAQWGCDYVLSFENVSPSGTRIYDGYILSEFSRYGYYLDICGIYTGYTTDSIYAELSDDFGVYGFLYGTIIWNEEMKNAYIQASYLDEVYSMYLDGTIKFSRGQYNLSAKGGFNNSFSNIIRFDINGEGDFLDNAATNLSQEKRTKFKHLDTSKLLGLKKKLLTQTQSGQ